MFRHANYIIFHFSTPPLLTLRPLSRCSLPIPLSLGEHVHTLSDDWKSANKEYMKFQKMNPIYGISKGQ